MRHRPWFVLLSAGVLLAAPAASATPPTDAGRLEVGDPELVSPSKKKDGPFQHYADQAISGDGQVVAYLTTASGATPVRGYPRWTDRETGVTRKILDLEGEKPFGCTDITVSQDGRWIAFDSTWPRLVPDDDNGEIDVFVYDTLTREIELVSRGEDGRPLRGASGNPSISADGSVVAFYSTAKVVKGDDNRLADAFALDRRTGELTLLSVALDGGVGDGSSIVQDMTPDGRFVVLDSESTDLVDDDTNGETDTFVRDLELGATERVSVASDGSEQAGFAISGTISGDGRLVAFSARGWPIHDDQPADDTVQIWVRDREEQTTTLLTTRRGTDGPADGDSWQADLTDDGRVLAFESEASDLVRGPTHERDAYVMDVRSGRVTIVRARTKGEPRSTVSLLPTISADGSWVAFSTPGSWDVADPEPPPHGWETMDVYVAEVRR